MTNAHFVEMELYPEPRPELQVTNKHKEKLNIIC